ncbi:MAG TPA: hypothetical protein VGD06_13350 [Acidobacteriota bacterium]|jgi:antitoxin (DNA-binding transcriptional repressor) of toxin-antitoxin stability system
MKNGLSRYLSYVQRGGRVVIFNRNTPVAELVPIESDAEPTSADLLASSVAELVRSGIVRRGRAKLRMERLRELSGKPSGVLDALLEERAGGR